MNALATIFTLISAVALLSLPRRWAPVPFLVGACYMTLNVGIEIGPFSFTIIRMLVLAGLIRIQIRGERLAGGMNTLDRLMVVWSVWMLISSVFHDNPSTAFINRLGLVLNAAGIYFLLRVFCQSFDDVAGLCRITVILLLPVAMEMIYERMTQHNIFYALGGFDRGLAVRGDRIRAQGPFGHSILAGTVGAVCLPLTIALWRTHKKIAVVGIGACAVIIMASASSAPILSAMAAIGALFLWHYRHHVRLLRRLAALCYIGLDLVMKAPAYYVMARLDFAGGSRGWHRARLIESAFEHLDEWWLGGTDYTRHWMPSGVAWSPEHTDITNHYIKMGVIGGLPLMSIFIVIMFMGFSLVGRTLRERPELSQNSRFMIWALGASLFAHAVTCISVSYFDQSFVFLYLTLAVIGSAWSAGIGTRESVIPVVVQQHNCITNSMNKVRPCEGMANG
jgi:hypothetical protein